MNSCESGLLLNFATGSFCGRLIAIPHPPRKFEGPTIDDRAILSDENDRSVFMYTKDLHIVGLTDGMIRRGLAGAGHDGGHGLEIDPRRNVGGAALHGSRV